MIEGPHTVSLEMHGCPPKSASCDFTAVLEQYRSAGFDAVSLNVGDGKDEFDVIRTRAKEAREQVRNRADKYRLVGTPEDIRAAKTDGVLAVFFDVEGAYSIGNQLDLVDELFAFGVRWMSFVYNVRNLAASGCHDKHDDGLAPFGRRLAQRMDEIGMIKCCSHASYRTALDVFERSALPCILSHSNPLALVRHPRNVPDEVLRACAQTGGVVGINGVGLFLGNEHPTVEDYFRALDYTVDLIGPRHVGIGIDSVFHDHERLGPGKPRSTEIWPPSLGYSDAMTILPPSILPQLRERMRRAGYRQSAIDAILGENFLRVFQTCIVRDSPGTTLRQT